MSEETLSLRDVLSPPPDEDDVANDECRETGWHVSVFLTYLTLR
jgi:hypothetical protein